MIIFGKHGNSDRHKAEDHYGANNFFHNFFLSTKNDFCVFVLVEFYERNLFNVTMLNTYSSKTFQGIIRRERVEIVLGMWG
jgi:hypothetical protein